MEWIDIFENTPNEPQEVIIYFKNEVGWHVGTAYWDGNVFMDLCEACGLREPYTPKTPIKKWMSLPSA
jgi:hypothetical protein